MRCSKEQLAVLIDLLVEAVLLELQANNAQDKSGTSKKPGNAA